MFLQGPEDQQVGVEGRPTQEVHCCWRRRCSAFCLAGNMAPDSRSCVAFGAAFPLGVITLNWYQRCVKWHAIMGKSEKRQKQVVCIIAILVLICMVKQIMRYKGMMF